MARKFSMDSTLTMTEKFTKPLANAGRAVAGFSRKMQTQFNGINRSVEKFNSNIRGKAVRAARTGMFALGAALGYVISQYASFDDAIFGATARFKSAEKPGTDMVKVMANLREAARKTGAETQFTATQAAQGLDKFALAGFTSQEAIMSLRSQVDLATVTGEEFMRVTDISSDLLGAFGGAVLKGAEKVAFLEHMNSLLAVGTLSANVTMEDLFETLKTAAPIASALGHSMEDTIAAVSVLGSAGIKGGMAATALKNIFLRLVNPTKAVVGAMGELGLKQEDFVNKNGKMKSAVEIFALLGKQAKGFSDVKVARLFSELAGLRGTAGALVLSKNIGQIREQLIRMGKDPQEVMKQTADFMRASLGNQLKILGSSLESVGFSFVEAFGKEGRGGIVEITKAVQNFDVQPVVDTLKSMFKILKFVFDVLRPFAPLILGVVIALQAYQLVVKIISVVTKVWAGVTWILNSALLANPITWIVLGVIALIAAVAGLVYGFVKLVMWLWSVRDAIIGGVVAGFNWLKDTFLSLPGWAQEAVNLLLIAFFPIIGIPLLIYRKFEFLKNKLFGVFGAIKSFTSGLFGGDGQDVNLNKNTSSTIQSQPIRGQVPGGGNSTTVNRSEVGINVNAPPGTTTSQSGDPGPGLTLNTGLN